MKNNEVVELCMNILNEEGVKAQMKEIYTPIINTIMQIVMPYIYLAIIFIILNFILMLMIFSVLIQNKVPKLKNLFYRI
tara:strand:- start:3426 stop:3662 length:237 start_codon:yes stop_codon:yes gene_type:complete